MCRIINNYFTGILNFFFPLFFIGAHTFYYILVYFPNIRLVRWWMRKYIFLLLIHISFKYSQGNVILFVYIYMFSIPIFVCLSHFYKSVFSFRVLCKMFFFLRWHSVTAMLRHSIHFTSIVLSEEHQTQYANSLYANGSWKIINKKKNLA